MEHIQFRSKNRDVFFFSKFESLKLFFLLKNMVMPSEEDKESNVLKDNLKKKKNWMLKRMLNLNKSKEKAMIIV